MNDRQEQSARPEPPTDREQPPGREQATGTPQSPASKRDTGAWRDPRRLPLSDLDQAMAVYSADGEVDDATGGDAGAEDTYGHEGMPKDKWTGLSAEPGGDPDATSEEGRRLRPSPDGPSPDGRTGPA